MTTYTGAQLAAALGLTIARFRATRRADSITRNPRRRVKGLRSEST